MSVNLNRAPHGATNIERACAAWGEPPRWIALLADACDRDGQREVAARLGKSAGYVSRILNRSYGGDYAEAERLTLAAFGLDRVHCPAMTADMALKTCMANRRRQGGARNWLHHVYDRTCPNCPNNTDREDD